MPRPAKGSKPEQGVVTRKQKLTKVSLADFMRVEVVEFTPNEHVCVIAGKNDNGKSSVVTFLRCVLGGAFQVPEQPVRKGAERATGVVETTDLRIEWSLEAGAKPSEAKLKVTHRGSAQTIRAPGTVLRNLFGTHALDPMGLYRLEPRQQLEYVNTVMVDGQGKPIDFAAYEQQHAKLYEERADARREADRLKAVLQATPEVPDAPAERVDIVAVARQLENARDVHQQHATAKANLVARVQAAVVGRERAKELADQIAALQRELDSLSASLDNEDKAIDAERDRLAGVSLPALEPLQKQLDNANSTNDAFDRAERHQQARAAHEAADQTFRDRKQALEDLENAHKKQLAESNLPIPGLSWKGSGFYLNDIPLSQASTRDKIFVAWQLAMAENPTLPVVFVDDANVLDEDAQKYIVELSHKHDAQTLIVFVGENVPDAQIVIRDGKVLKQPSQ